MAEKVAKLGVKREDGYLYFIDKDGDVSRSVMARGGKKGGKTRPVFSLLNAKWWLADNMPEELENLPERSDGEEKPKQGDLFKNW